MKYCDSCQAVYPNEFNVCPKDLSVLRVSSELIQGMVIREKYRIEEKIGAGGMATVYRARHIAFNEQRALKVVRAELAEDEGFRKRFRTEAVVTRRLQHPNAVRVDDLDTTEDGRPFIVMELVHGKNLRQAIAQDGPFPAKRAISIARQVGLALDAAHGLGITHRDIKPDNILLVDEVGDVDVVKVLDFGIAKIREGSLDVGSGYTSTGTGMVVGTPQYISPEQAMGTHGVQIDGRADLYSLGVVIYEMLTGRLPFYSDTPLGMVLHHIQTIPQPPDQLRPDLSIPVALSAILMRTLEKDPQRRFQTAKELVSQLDSSWSSSPSLFGEERRKPPNTTHTPTISSEPLRQHSPIGVSFGKAEATSSPVKSKRKNLMLLIGIGLLLTGLGMTVSRFLGHKMQGRPTPEVRNEPPTLPSTAPAEADDQNLVGTVKRALASTAWGRESSIDVSAKDGVVTLTGKASKTSAEMAAVLAGAIPGVTRIVNRLDTGSSTPTSYSSAPIVPRAVTAKPSSTPRESQQIAGHVRLLVDEGNQFLNAGDYEKAVRSFQAALALDPNNTTAKSGLDRTNKAARTENEILQRR